jgi:hypothetical protein
MAHSMPVPPWKPDLVEDVGLVTNKLRDYTNGVRAFVVYKCGTAVFSDTAAGRPDQDYEATLVAVGHQAPDFRVLPMKDGNYLVRFSGPVCGVVLGDFYGEHAKEIREKIGKGGLLPGEQVLDAREVSAPVEHYYIGLFARAKLYRDIEEKIIADRFIP